MGSRMNREELTQKLEDHAPQTVGWAEDGDIEGCTCGWKLEWISTPQADGHTYRSWVGYFDDYREHLLDILEDQT